MAVRKAVFAGSWYPGTSAACEQEIRKFLSQTTESANNQSTWMGGIVPHAGWFYSGQIACNVIHRLKGEVPPDVVVIFGMHLHPASANYIMAQGAWETPFGDLPVAEDLAQYLLQRFDFQKETPQKFTQDNTIELQLPFVKYLLDPGHILALGVPPTGQSLKIGCAVVEWARENNKHLKIIGSTDLTHYGSNYGFSPHGSGPKAVDWVRNENDHRVIEAILAMAPEQVIEESVQHQNACCAGAAATALAAVKSMGADQSLKIDYATSYDKSPGDSFVGYVGAVFGA